MSIPKLHKGDRVALVDASGPVPEARLEKSVQAVESFGLQPVVYDSCRARHGYLAGTDELRARDLTDAFLDDSLAGVLCIRGGYGAPPPLAPAGHRRHRGPLEAVPRLFRRNRPAHCL